jgi:hypothetical protein
VVRVDHLEAEREREKAYAEARTIVEPRAARRSGHSGTGQVGRVRPQSEPPTPTWRLLALPLLAMA